MYSWKELQGSARVWPRKDKAGAVIPSAKVQLITKGHPEVTREIATDPDGEFILPDIDAGEYELRVTSLAFWEVWQPFEVHRPDSKSSCNRPIRVVMAPAGGCSYVSNA